MSAAPSPAAALARDALVWDALFPATPACGSFAAHGAALERMRRAGVTVASLTMAYDPEDAATALTRVAAWRRFAEAHAERFMLLDRPGAARSAQASGRLALGLHFQGATPYGKDLALVETFAALGVRQSILVYNRASAVGDGCHEPRDAGLSGFGRELVAEMQRVGVLVDLSHCGRRLAEEALETAAAPMAYTHANPSALHAHERNIPDALAQACAATGGVVGVCGVSMFLGEGPATVDRLFAHLDHWTALLGPAHVGLGLDSVTDFETTYAAIRAEASKWPAGQGYQAGGMSCLHASDLVALTERMLAAGYGAPACRQILGENWLRLAERLWGDGADEEV